MNGSFAGSGPPFGNPVARRRAVRTKPRRNRCGEPPWLGQRRGRGETSRRAEGPKVTARPLEQGSVARFFLLMNIACVPSWRALFMSS